MTQKAVCVIENGEQLDCTQDEAELLIQSGIIYRCPECDESIAHVSAGRTLDEAVDLLDSEWKREIG